ncbi:MAG: hypothetical protein WA876_13490 [Candidatus Acidiferrales bacterium]
MAKGKKPSQTQQKALDNNLAKTRRRGRKRRSERIVHDALSEKKSRGRPATILASTVVGRANNYRYQLKQVWLQLEGPLVAAKTENDVKAALETHAPVYASSYVPFQVPDILALIHDKKFPKDPEARINFLADSLGGRSILTFRSSRDVCARERAKERAKSPYQILRYEYYVECSCGYEGPARDGACRKCGAVIPLSAADLQSLT